MRRKKEKALFPLVRLGNNSFIIEEVVCITAAAFLSVCIEAGGANLRLVENAGNIFESGLRSESLDTRTRNKAPRYMFSTVLPAHTHALTAAIQYIQYCTYSSSSEDFHH